MKLLLLITATLLSGCSTLGVIADRASTANDEALKTCEYIMCYGASTGAIERMYDTEELKSSRSNICNREREPIE